MNCIVSGRALSPFMILPPSAGKVGDIFNEVKVKCLEGYKSILKTYHLIQDLLEHAGAEAGAERTC